MMLRETAALLSKLQRILDSWWNKTLSLLPAYPREATGYAPANGFTQEMENMLWQISLSPSSTFFYTSIDT
jgi:hypothetical protein